MAIEQGLLRLRDEANRLRMYEVGLWDDRTLADVVRAIGPPCARGPNGLAGNIGTRPCVGLKPTMPQNDAGIRMLPPPSVPTEHGASHAATAAALPPGSSSEV